MRISDWSSDVCSSDLSVRRHPSDPARGARLAPGRLRPTLVLQTGGCPPPLASLGRVSPRLVFPDAEAAADLLTFASRAQHLGDGAVRLRAAGGTRSEEHTSELQSLMRIS